MFIIMGVTTISMWVIIILTTECKKCRGISGQRGGGSKQQEEGKADQKVECQAASNITTDHIFVFIFAYVQHNCAIIFPHKYEVKFTKIFSNLSSHVATFSSPLFSKLRFIQMKKIFIPTPFKRWQV